MFQYTVSLNHRWLAILASCLLVFVMLMAVMPPSARSRPAASGIIIAPSSSSLSVDVSKSITHTFTVTNTGADDVFTLTAVSDNLWPTQIKVAGVVTAQLALSASMSAPVDVVVTATVLPGGTAALPYARDVATFTVVARSSPSISATARLTTTRNTYTVTIAPLAATQIAEPGTAVTYTLRVTNTGNITDTFDLTQTSSLSVWPVSLFPLNVLSLTATSGVSVSVVITIPMGTDGGITNYTHVTATSTADRAQWASAILTTRTPLTAGVELTPVMAALSGNPGATLAYTLSLANTGNATDTFSLTVSSAYATSLVSSTGNLAKGVRVTITAAVTIPTNALADAVNVSVITATSQVSNSAFAKAVLTTTVKTVYSLTLAAPVYAKSGGLGTAVNYSAQIANTGNAADVFTLTVVGGNWTATISGTALVSLPAFSNTNVTVVVNIPPTADEYSSDVATLTATSRGKPALITSVKFTTTGRTVKVYLPIVLRDWPPPSPWTPGSGDITTKTVYQIAVCPVDSNRLYAGTITSGVYASKNAGLSWSQTSLGGALVRGLAVNPTNCDEAYAFASGQGVMKTKDGGANWSSPGNSGLGEPYGYSVVVDPSQPQTVYAGTNALGVYSSIDGGAHWSHTAIPNTAVLGLSIGSDGAVYAATFGTGVYRLKNGGADQLSGGDLSATANVFAVVAASPSILFAATETGLYRSANSGTTWTLVPSLSGKGRVFSVLIDPNNTSIVYAGVEFSGVWRSVDGGLTFNSYSQGMPTAGVGVRNIAIGSATSSYLHAGTALNGAWRVAYP